MILAAGRGNRLRPLTDETPKPLILLGGKPLITYHLKALSLIGVKDVVINVAYQAKKIQKMVGLGEEYGLQIHYSVEPEEKGLETGGGIFKALPLLGKDPFLVVNGDIWTDYPFADLNRELDDLAHLVLVNNPPYRPQGDFGLQDGKILFNDSSYLTFSGIGLYRPELFADCEPGFFPLITVLKKAIAQQKISGERYSGKWVDIGTIERLNYAETLLVQKKS